MNLVQFNTMADPSFLDDQVEGEQFVQVSRYTRSHSGGGYTDVYSYVAASKGKADVRFWVKEFLSEEKEELYIRALRNLYRRIDFIELNQSLEMDDITEEEFDKELETNESKYLIPNPQERPTIQQIVQITDIINRLGREKIISVDEVSELFSLEMDKAMAILHD